MSAFNSLHSNCWPLASRGAQQLASETRSASGAERRESVRVRGRASPRLPFGAFLGVSDESARGRQPPGPASGRAGGRVGRRAGRQANTAVASLLWPACDHHHPARKNRFPPKQTHKRRSDFAGAAGSAAPSKRQARSRRKWARSWCAWSAGSARGRVSEAHQLRGRRAGERPRPFGESPKVAHAQARRASCTRLAGRPDGLIPIWRANVELT